jgi:hypothetical protein
MEILLFKKKNLNFFDPFYPQIMLRNLKKHTFHEIFLDIIQVKPVYNDHPRDPKIVAVVDRWSLFDCTVKPVHYDHLWDQKKVVVTLRWSLFRGSKFSLIKKFH